MVIAEFHVRLNRRDIITDEVIDDLRRVAAELQSPSITKVQYDERGIFGATTVLRKLGSWNSALQAAGLEVRNRQDISNDELFENIANVWMKIGRQPFGRDIQGKRVGSLFALGTYEKRFGSWNKALLAFSDYVQFGKDAWEEQVSSESRVFPAGTSRRRTPREINWRLRAKVLIKHSCICQMCGDSPAKNPDTVLHVDHILAWANGGETVEENLQTLCAKCNIGKSDQLLPGQDPP
jgi:HNH endonuclease/Homing endonuclease associated repeat